MSYVDTDPIPLSSSPIDKEVLETGRTLYVQDMRSDIAIVCNMPSKNGAWRIVLLREKLRFQGVLVMHRAIIAQAMLALWQLCQTN
jgi:hypothetical protein